MSESEWKFIWLCARCRADFNGVVKICNECGCEKIDKTKARAVIERGKPVGILDVLLFRPVDMDTIRYFSESGTILSERTIHRPMFLC